jgi:hypothetical protein
MPFTPSPGVPALPAEPPIAAGFPDQLPPDVPQAPTAPGAGDPARALAGAGRRIEGAITGAPPVTPADVPSSDWDIVDEWGTESFPASDPPANW